MKIKMAMGVTAGVAAASITGVVLWVFTRMEALHMVAVMMGVYAFATAGVLALVEGMEIAVKVKIRRTDRPQLYNLRDYPEWREKGGK